MVFGFMMCHFAHPRVPHPYQTTLGPYQFHHYVVGASWRRRRWDGGGGREGTFLLLHVAGPNVSLARLATDLATEFPGTGWLSEELAGTSGRKNADRSSLIDMNRNGLGCQQRFTKPLLYR